MTYTSPTLALQYFPGMHQTDLRGRFDDIFDHVGPFPLLTMHHADVINPSPLHLEYMFAASRLFLQIALCREEGKVLRVSMGRDIRVFEDDGASERTWNILQGQTNLKPWSKSRNLLRRLLCRENILCKIMLSAGLPSNVDERLGPLNLNIPFRMKRSNWPRTTQYYTYENFQRQECLGNSLKFCVVATYGGRAPKDKIRISTEVDEKWIFDLRRLARPRCSKLDDRSYLIS